MNIHLGWLFTAFVTVCCAWFMYLVYPKPVEVGYSPSQIAQMDALVANIVPLSVADIGLDAEEFMEGVR